MPITGVPTASKAEAEAGTIDDKAMTPLGVSQHIAAKRMFFPLKSPVDFGAVADGALAADGSATGTDNREAIQDYLDDCALNGLKAILPAGLWRIGKDSSTNQSTLTVRCDFECLGSLLFENDKLEGPAILVSPGAADLSYLSLAAVNAWTNCKRGATKIGGLTGMMGRVISVDTASELLIRRRGETSQLRMGQTVYVVTDDGVIASPLMADWNPASWTGQPARAEWVRDRISVRPRIILTKPTSAGAEGRNPAVQCERSNTTVGGRVTRVAGDAVLQAFYVRACSRVTVEEYEAYDLISEAQNYGLNVDLSSHVVVNNGTGSNCRRNLDAHRSTDVTVFGGLYPDGIGAHWVNRMTIIGATVGGHQPTNPQAFQFAGGNITVIACDIHIRGAAHTMFNVREDFMEMAGNVTFTGCNVEFDSSGTTDVTLFDLYGTSTIWDPGRTLRYPDSISMDGSNTVTVRGTTNRNLVVLKLLKGLPGMPQSIRTQGRIDISPKITLENGNFDSSGLPRARATLTKPACAVGSGYDIRFAPGVPMLVQPLPEQTTGNTPTARCNVTVEGDDAVIRNAPGGYQRCVINGRRGAISRFTAYASYPPQGDEEDVTGDPYDVVRAGSFTGVNRIPNGSLEGDLGAAFPLRVMTAPFTVERVRDNSLSGRYCLRLDKSQVAPLAGTLYTGTDFQACAGGETLDFSAYLRGSESSPASSAYLRFQTFLADGTATTTAPVFTQGYGATSAAAGANGRDQRAALSTAWAKVGTYVTLPADARLFKFTIFLISSTATCRYLYVDEIVLKGLPLGMKDTGWTADTGTAKKSATATYVPPAAAGSYSQTEMQAVMNALRDATQTNKGIKDVLLAHGLIGA